MAKDITEQQKLKEITFLDIETIPRVPEDHDFIDLFEKRFKKEIDELVKKNDMVNPLALHALNLPELTEEDIVESFYNEKAGMYAEWGQIISIAIGRINAAGKLYVKIIANPDEKALLSAAEAALDKAEYIYLCAHNGLEFDFPFLTRRFLANGMKVPRILNTGGKKPWDLPYIDTMQMWSGTQWNYKVSLDLLCKVLGVNSPKQSAVTGKNIHQFWQAENMTQEEKLKAIGDYNAGDVVANVNVYCKLKGLPVIEQSMIEYVFEKFETNLLNQ